ncbi:MAG: hypothetical protein JNJ73_18305 [Hyphomonadaceae bacterium]|nr:hypothetical protein [Hyphomonadaceae bacterium]
MPRLLPLIALAAATLALGLGGCASLSADAPLFAVADQVGPAPLEEGVWIWPGEHCSARNAKRRGRLPAKCLPGELRRSADGAWTFRFQDHVPLRESADEPEMPRAYRLIIAPATHVRAADAFAPLYVAEYAPAEPTDTVQSYALIVPVGTLPAREFRIETTLSCTAIDREGPIEGITITRNESGETITACKATTQDGVREAARRAAIEGLNGMLANPNEEGARLLFVRP